MAEILFREADLVIVELRGGDVDGALDALCLDLSPGSCTRYEWRALVQRKLVGSLLESTGALPVAIETWDGERFGDGNGGTVQLTSTGILDGDGLDETAFQAEV